MRVNVPMPSDCDDLDRRREKNCQIRQVPQARSIDEFEHQRDRNCGAGRIDDHAARIAGEPVADNFLG